MVNSSAGGPIGVFDSGLGGLTVVQEIWRHLPDEEVVYVGDTARVPYGGRSAEEIRCFNREIIGFLLQQGAKLVVFACNTSSALAFPVMQREFPVPMVEVITPGARAAAAATRNGRIGLLATEATVRSGAYVRAILGELPGAQVTAVACPLLVPLVESGRAGSAEAARAVVEYLEPVREAGADTLVLGCTHYPYLRPHLQEQLERGVALIDPAVETARRVGEVLAAHELRRHGPRRGDRFYTSGDPALFRRLAGELTGRTLPPVERVEFSSPVLGVNAAGAGG
ncbi:MAG: glutamate racemase [Bacillota bacterium]|nr:glutamate racemase [Bacillota bacterium]